MGFWYESIIPPFNNGFYENGNGDGVLDPVQRGIQLDYLDSLMDEADSSYEYKNYYNDDSDDDDY